MRSDGRDSLLHDHSINYRTRHIPDLKTRTKLFELYALHVLPRNERWARARAFVMAAELNSEERHRFQQTLDVLEKEQKAGSAFDKSRDQEESQLQRSNQSRGTADVNRTHARTQRNMSKSVEDSLRQGKDHDTDDYVVGTDRTSVKRSTAPNGKPATSSRKRAPMARIGKNSSTLSASGVGKFDLMVILKGYIVSLINMMRLDPWLYLRTLLFIVGLLFTLGRAEYRDRVRKITAAGWDKLKATVGMGVKVNYI